MNHQMVNNEKRTAFFTKSDNFKLIRVIRSDS